MWYRCIIAYETNPFVTIPFYTPIAMKLTPATCLTLLTFLAGASFVITQMERSRQFLLYVRES